MNSEQPVPLTTEQLSGFLRLVRGADSVELKLTVPDTDRAEVLAERL
ncbi:MAG TPA: hypothetical protein VK306_03530 [Acidimicrobiales bacterium]|nr:hypothetical protein [Acidimicrobiales bacterium]